jgi:hypothetical protein
MSGSVPPRTATESYVVHVARVWPRELGQHRRVNKSPRRVPRSEPPLFGPKVAGHANTISEPAALAVIPGEALRLEDSDLVITAHGSPHSAARVRILAMPENGRHRTGHRKSRS